MRQATRKGLMTVAAATGVIAAAGSGYAHAASGASGTAAGSPGVLSGNSVQAPVHAPVNVCGNTVDVVGVLNPAAGNTCANESDTSDGHGGSGGSGSHGGSGSNGGSGAPGGSGAHGGSSGSHAGGQTSDSPGVGSGNHVEAPVDTPVNVCGNSVDVIGIGNPAMGNNCADQGGGDHTTPPGTPGNPGNPGTPGHPGTPETPGHPGTPATPPAPGHETPGGPSHPNQPGAQTVTQPRGEAQLASTGSELPLGIVLPAGAGALLGGAVLYRRARASA
ncbi:chaplin [Streptomyces griseosporeus]|uniref:chaplin n=1 Tax=Streptomyces griseosporeus TaxID=1910 RepID=UPI0037021334